MVIGSDVAESRIQTVFSKPVLPSISWLCFIFYRLSSHILRQPQKVQVYIMLTVSPTTGKIISLFTSCRKVFLGVVKSHDQTWTNHYRSQRMQWSDGPSISAARTLLNKVTLRKRRPPHKQNQDAINTEEVNKWVKQKYQPPTSLAKITPWQRSISFPTFWKSLEHPQTPQARKC